MLKFWIWWNNEPTQINLHDGEAVNFESSKTTDEGWTFKAHTYTREGAVIHRRIFQDGRDCDGRLSSDDHYQCDKLHLQSKLFEGHLYPAWERVDSEVYDEEAQKAGY